VHQALQLAPNFGSGISSSIERKHSIATQPYKILTLLPPPPLSSRFKRPTESAACNRVGFRVSFFRPQAGLCSGLGCGHLRPMLRNLGEGDCRQLDRWTCHTLRLFFLGGGGFASETENAWGDGYQVAHERGKLHGSKKEKNEV
jgi:hypothetical protein